MSRKKKTSPPVEYTSYKKYGNFTPVFKDQYISQAYQALSLGARDLYLFIRMHAKRGNKPGEEAIVLTYRQMADAGIRRNSIKKYLHELEVFGFIRIERSAKGISDKGMYPNENKYWLIEKWKYHSEGNMQELKKKLNNERKQIENTARKDTGN